MGRFNSPSNSSTSTDNDTKKWPPRATLRQIENANKHLNGYHSDNALGLQHFYGKGIFCIRDDLSDFKKAKKYACKACKTGNRSKECIHFERMLELVNPVGRPVTGAVTREEWVEKGKKIAAQTVKAVFKHGFENKLPIGKKTQFSYLQKMVENSDAYGQWYLLKYCFKQEFYTNATEIKWFQTKEHVLDTLATHSPLDILTMQKEYWKGKLNSNQMSYIKEQLEQDLSRVEPYSLNDELQQSPDEKVAKVLQNVTQQACGIDQAINNQLVSPQTPIKFENYLDVPDNFSHGFQLYALYQPMFVKDDVQIPSVVTSLPPGYAPDESEPHLSLFDDFSDDSSLDSTNSQYSSTFAADDSVLDPALESWAGSQAEEFQVNL